MEHRSNSRGASSNAPNLPRTGRYQLLHPLGRGAFGQVFACYDPVLDRQLAVKVLSGELPANLREEFLERFWNEVRVLARLSHPNVVLVHDAGLEGPYPYVVMELCSGPSLDDVLGSLPRGAPAMPLCQAAWLVVQVARALDYVHSRGIIHRDVKPANLMFHHGILKLTDFGLAHTALSNLTSAGQVLGTPAFMSPEQVRGEQIDHRSDLYSLGALLFHLLTGRSPFLGTPYAIMSQLVQSDPPIFSQVASSLPRPENPLASPISPPDLPASLDAFFVRALAREPDGRFSSGAELCEALFAIMPEKGLRPVEGLEPTSQPEVPGALGTVAMDHWGHGADTTLRIECQSSSWWASPGNEAVRTRAFPHAVVLEGGRAPAGLADPGDQGTADASGILHLPPLNPSRREERMAAARPLSSVSRLRRRSPWVSPALLSALMISALFGWEWRAGQARPGLFSADPDAVGAATVEVLPAGYDCDVIGEAVSAGGRPSDASAKVRRRPAAERKVVARSMRMTPASCLASRTPREDAAEDLPIPAISSPSASSPSTPERIRVEVRFDPQIAR